MLKVSIDLFARSVQSLQHIFILLDECLNVIIQIYDVLADHLGDEVVESLGVFVELFFFFGFNHPLIQFRNGFWLAGLYIRRESRRLGEVLQLFVLLQSLVCLFNCLIDLLRFFEEPLMILGSRFGVYIVDLCFRRVKWLHLGPLLGEYIVAESLKVGCGCLIGEFTDVAPFFVLGYGHYFRADGEDRLRTYSRIHGKNDVQAYQGSFHIIRLVPVSDHCAGELIKDLGISFSLFLHFYVKNGLDQYPCQVCFFQVHYVAHH